MRIAVYPGSFDPITCGHLDIIERVRCLFDRVIVAVAVNDRKRPFFTAEERLAMIRAAVGGFPNVEVDSFSGLLVNFVRLCGAQVVVRGLRAVSDFEAEFQMALMNRRLNPEVETLFMMTSPEYSYVSSRIVKEIASLGGSVAGLVPEDVEQQLMEKFGEGRSFLSTSSGC